jgi:tight adherence protein C
MFDPANIPAAARIAVLLLVFLIVVVSVLAGSSLINARLAVRRRLDERLTPAVASGGTSLRSDDTNKAWVRFINSIENRGLSLADTQADKLRAKLVAAGYAHPIAPRLFTFIRLALTLALPIAFVAISYASGDPPGILKLYFGGAGCALAGLYFPNLWITVKADRRKREIINGFPDALDLMLVCVEAGLGLEAAFARVGSEMLRVHPLLADMLGNVVLELRAGRSREDALRRMADRAQVDEIRAFTTLLIQSTKLGSSLGQTLRVYAAEMREQRRMRAEEKAHRLPVLLSVPLVTCMLPVMIGVLMLPAIIRVLRQLLPALAGGGGG